MPHTANRQRILKAAVRLFSENGYNGTDLEAIAKAARCSESTMGHLFQTKGDLFIAALYAVCSTRIESTPLTQILRDEPDFEKAFHQVMDIIFKTADRTFIRLRTFGFLERPDIISKYFLDTTYPYYEALITRIRRERANGTLRKDIEPESAAMAAISIVYWRRVLMNMAPLPVLKKAMGRNTKNFIDIWLRGTLRNTKK